MDRVCLQVAVTWNVPDEDDSGVIGKGWCWVGRKPRWIWLRGTSHRCSRQSVRKPENFVTMRLVIRMREAYRVLAMTLYFGRNHFMPSLFNQPTKSTMRPSGFRIQLVQAWHRRLSELGVQQGLRSSYMFSILRELRPIELRGQTHGRRPSRKTKLQEQEKVPHGGRYVVVDDAITSVHTCAASTAPTLSTSAP